MRAGFLTEACNIVFHLRVNHNIYTKSALIQTFRNELAEQIQHRAKEATIDVFAVEGDSEGRTYSLKVRVVCWLKNPSYNYVIRRFISNLIGKQRIGIFYSPGTIRIYQMTSESVRQSYVSPSPQGSNRWLHHSILCSKAHNMSFQEFVEELGKTVKNEEMDLRSCTTLEQVMKDAWRKQTLLYSIHGVLLARLSSGQQTAPQGVGPDVGTAAEAAFPYPQPLNAASTTMHSAATTGAAGAVHPNSAAETVGTTPQTGRNVSSEMNSGSVAAPATRKKLQYDGSPDAAAVGAPAPVEVSVLRESHGTSGDSQVHDTSTAMNGQSGITAFQFCIGCRKVQVDLKLVAGAEKKRGTHKRAGRRHRKHNISSVAGDASTECSPESTPEKKQPDRVRPACASTTPAIETKRANDLKRQRSCSPAREPDSGLFVDDFGDYAREYQAACDVYANVPAFQGPSKSSVHERRYDGFPTSCGKLSYWAIRNRQDDTKVGRQEYQNWCASRHCEKALLINNPFVEACQCSRPSAGDMLC